MKIDQVWAEMARRKVQFHNKEKWNEIRLWLLAKPREVKKFTQEGLLHAYGGETPKVLNWYQPSEEAWVKYIKPLVDNFSMGDLLILTTWVTRPYSTMIYEMENAVGVNWQPCFYVEKCKVHSPTYQAKDEWGCLRWFCKPHFDLLLQELKQKQYDFDRKVKEFELKTA